LVPITAVTAPGRALRLTPCIDHLLIAGDVIQTALGQNRALVQHRHPAIEAAHEFHVMFDHHHGAGFSRAFQDIGGVFAFGRCHPGGGLVHQQQARVLRQKHADFQPLLLAMAQFPGAARQRIRKADFLGQFCNARRTARRAAIEQHIERPALGLERHGKVFAHGLVLEHGGFLELAANARPRDLAFAHPQKRDVALSPDHPALIGPRLAGDDIHKGGLARAIGADHGAQFRLCDLDRQVVDGAKPVECDRDARDFEKRGHGLLTIMSKSPPMPRGKNSVTATNPRPKSTSHQSVQLIR
jgi:hypothetical protein